MHARRTLTVSITPEQDTLVRACVASGRYASASEVVRAALRLLDERERALPLSDATAAGAVMNTALSG